MSAWIQMVSDEDADERLLQILNEARTPHGTVDNVMRVHSLRPNTMRGHVALYKAALHDDDNTLPQSLQETIASYVSVLNQCDYSWSNHWANAAHLINDSLRSEQVERALKLKKPELAFQDAELAMLKYAEKLTVFPGEMRRSDVDDLKAKGISDGEILEVNQIVGYFNYVNRLLNGLGVSTEGDIVGYYAKDD